MKSFWILLMILSINTSFANSHSQIIYQYKNSYNVTEFTDRADTEKTLTQKFEINKSTVEQQEAINQALEKLRTFNKDFNQRYYDEKKRQYEAAKKKSEEKKIAQQQARADHASDVNKLSRHKRHKHLRRDAIRKKKGKTGHSY